MTREEASSSASSTIKSIGRTQVASPSFMHALTSVTRSVTSAFLEIRRLRDPMELPPIAARDQTRAVRAQMRSLSLPILEVLYSSFSHSHGLDTQSDSVVALLNATDALKTLLKMRYGTPVFVLSNIADIHSKVTVRSVHMFRMRLEGNEAIY